MWAECARRRGASADVPVTGSVNAARIPQSRAVNAARISQSHAVNAARISQTRDHGPIRAQGRALDDEELPAEQLHAVLDPTLMVDPGQRWADSTALVDANMRGRGTTAATSGARGRA